MKPIHYSTKPSDDAKSIKRMKTLERHCWTACLLLSVSLTSTARSQSLYWDGNGATAGAGLAPVGIWGTDSFWSTDANGELATGAWIAGGNAIFSAGADAVGAFAVELSAPQTVGSLNFDEGNVVLSGVSPTTNLTWNGSVSPGSRFSISRPPAFPRR